MRGLAATVVLLALAGPVADEAGCAAIVDGVNRARAEAGLPPVRADPRLALAAGRHAQDMAEHDFFSHQGSDGSRVDTRVRGAAYPYHLVAENIAVGQTVAAEVVEGWMQSDGHRQNILRPTVRDAGVAHLAPYWVLVLGEEGE